jgi:hypothetical protein
VNVRTGGRLEALRDLLQKHDDEVERRASVERALLARAEEIRTYHALVGSRCPTELVFPVLFVTRLHAHENV